MFDEVLRPVKDRLFTPVARGLAGRVHPNLVSIAALPAGLAAAWFAASRRYDLSLVWWTVNRLLDGLDGVVARESGRQTAFGGYLDIILDYVIYAAIPVGLAIGAPSASAERAALVLLASFLVNVASWMYLAALLEQRAAGARTTGERTSVTMPGGLIEGTETMVFYTLFLVWPEQLTGLFAIMAALVIVTAGQRMVWAARRL